MAVRFNKHPNKLVRISDDENRLIDPKTKLLEKRISAKLSKRIEIYKIVKLNDVEIIRSFKHGYIQAYIFPS